MYEPIVIEDGDPAFGIDGTFQIHNTIYVLTDEADAALLECLAARGYHLHKVIPDRDDFYAAQQPHKQTRAEVIDDVLHGGGLAIANASTLMIDMKYMNAARFSLKELFIHDQIIISASQRHDIGYYNQPHDQMSDIALSRMSGFVKNMVDVPFERWENFISESRQYHAVDFIRAMAHWASRESNYSTRIVCGGLHGESEIISGADQFKITKAQPIPFFGRGHKYPPPR